MMRVFYRKRYCEPTFNFKPSDIRQIAERIEQTLQTRQQKSKQAHVSHHISLCFIVFASKISRILYINFVHKNKTTEIFSWHLFILELRPLVNRYKHTKTSKCKKQKLNELSMWSCFLSIYLFIYFY